MALIYITDKIIEEDYPLSLYKKNIINKTTSEKRIEELINGEKLLIKALVSSGFKVDLPLEIEIKNNNKPFLKNKNIYYNLSHSGNNYAIAIANQEVGIDIEIINDKHTMLAKKILTNLELECYKKDPDKAAYITKIWTIKESYLKMLGIGLTSELNQLETIYLSSDSFDLFSINDTKILCKKIDTYYLSIAFKNECENVEIIFL
ncbi:4'-phosphopantetheinyl transferase superfamily protein [Acholeplasma sp. OttesenSCG-928-E16]|nr:4'-phosphopantetheinyl transferase superfamily protein [Acholeplasma sp. OttesenSCG-928-E16]